LIGQQVLTHAWEGYHCTLFAYGQTGSGKSYTVMGYKPNFGIVPMACEEIFTRINLEKSNPSSAQVEYEVNFSMMEIYNEKV